MKKNFCALFLLLFPLLCFGQNNLHFSISPRISLTFGELTELLYDSQEEIASQLDWEEKSLLNLGLEADLNYKNLIVNATFDYSLPLGTSFMYDSDWENGAKYSLTEHPIESIKNIDTALTLAYQLKASPEFFLIPALQINYIFSDFEAGIGSGTRYGRDIRVYGIDYKRHTVIVFAGLSVKAQLLSNFSIKTDFFAAPWNYQYSYDYHHGVQRPFSSYEIQTAYFSKFKVNFSADFTFTKICSLQLFANLLFGVSDKGDFYSDYYSSQVTYVSTQKSGASIHNAKIGSALIFAF